jgi:hypothetical protein
MQRPAVREKVEALRHAKTTESGLIASREWVEAQFVMTLDRISRGLETGDMDSNARENGRLMISGLMQFAEIQGLDRGPEAGGDRQAGFTQRTPRRDACAFRRVSGGP